VSLKWPIPTKYVQFVCYNRVFVIAEFVITEFDCIWITHCRRALRSVIVIGYSIIILVEIIISWPILTRYLWNWPCFVRLKTYVLRLKTYVFTKNVRSVIVIVIESKHFNYDAIFLIPFEIFETGCVLHFAKHETTKLSAFCSISQFSC